MCRTALNVEQLFSVTMKDGTIELDVPDDNDTNDDELKINVKIEALMRMIDATVGLVRSERKAVIFSQFPSIFEAIVCDFYY